MNLTTRRTIGLSTLLVLFFGAALWLGRHGGSWGQADLLGGTGESGGLQIAYEGREHVVGDNVQLMSFSLRAGQTPVEVKKVTVLLAVPDATLRQKMAPTVQLFKDQAAVAQCLVGEDVAAGMTPVNCYLVPPLKIAKQSTTILEVRGNNTDLASGMTDQIQILADRQPGGAGAVEWLINGVAMNGYGLKYLPVMGEILTH